MEPIRYSFGLGAVAVALAFAGCLCGMERPQPVKPDAQVAVTLVDRAESAGRELVNFGLPLPPGFLRDTRMVRVAVVVNRPDEVLAIRNTFFPISRWKR
jgi:hypothetical protein